MAIKIYYNHKHKDNAQRTVVVYNLISIDWRKNCCNLDSCLNMFFFSVSLSPCKVCETKATKKNNWMTGWETKTKTSHWVSELKKKCFDFFFFSFSFFFCIGARNTDNINSQLNRVTEHDPDIVIYIFIIKTRFSFSL